MKKRLTKLLLLMAVLIVGSGTSWAQTDVTAQYLTNADFSQGTVIDNHVCTYGKDMGTNGTTYYGAQTISGWTNASAGVTNEGYSGCGIAGALFAYGGTPWIGGAGNTAPATGPEGAAGNAAGLEAVWANKIQYTQDVTLPAGSYTLVYKVYNKTTGSGNSSAVITSNLFGFIAGETTYYAPNNTFAIGQWSNVAVTFNLASETTGKVSMGYVGPEGNAVMPHLFVDNVKILRNVMYQDATDKVNKTGWTGASDGYQGGTINTARQFGDMSIGRHIYQTISGLDNGTYEIALYSISQKEWDGTLANHAGDVAYVFADNGTTEYKEWINARARNSYPGDENVGIYTISGVRVTNGTLTLGMGLAQKDLTQWHHVQIKSLVRTMDPYNPAIAAAKAIDQTQRMSSSVKTALNTAITTYDTGNVNLEDGEAIQAAANALEEAIRNAQASINSYKILESGTLPDNSLNGWTCTNTNNFEINTWSGEGNSDGTNMKTPFIQNWVWKGNNGDVVLGTGEIYYSLPGLDPGIYSFSALIRAYSEAGNAPTGASLFAMEREKEFATGHNFEFNNMKGIYDTYTMSGQVGEDGIFRFGVKIKDNRNFNWMAFKNCKISYVGAAIDEAAVQALAATMPEGKMNKDIKEAAQTALQALQTTINLDNYEAATQAVAAAIASAEAYTAAGTKLEAMKNDIVDKTNVYTDQAYNDYYGTWKTKYDENTLTTDEANALQNPNQGTGWHDPLTVDNFLLSAWNTKPDFVDDPPYYINTWSVEGNNDGSNFKVPFFEYWTGNGNSLGERTLTATMSNIDPGTYAVSAWVRVRAKDGYEAPAKGITMQVNDGYAVNVCNGEPIANSQFFIKNALAFGTVGESGELKINFNVAANNNISWLSFKNVKFEISNAITDINTFKTQQPAVSTALLLKDAEILHQNGEYAYIQDANSGIAIKKTFTDGNVVNGQLFGTYENFAKMVVENNPDNQTTVTNSEAPLYTTILPIAEAKTAENVYRRVMIEEITIEKEGEDYYAVKENARIKIVNDLCKTLVLNDGDIVNSITGITLPNSDNNGCVLAPLTQNDVVPLLWVATEADPNVDMAVGVPVSSTNMIDLTTDEKLERVKVLVAGDVLNLKVVSVGNAATVEVLAGDKTRNIFTIPAKVGTVEIPITPDVVKEINKHGLAIAGENYNATMLSVLNAKYNDTENAIWLGDGATATLGAAHFEDVRANDVITITGNAGELTPAITSGEALTADQAAAIQDKTLTWTGNGVTKIAMTLGSVRDDKAEIEENEDGTYDSFDQGETILQTSEKAVNGLVMTYGGKNAEGKKYTYKEIYPEVNKFGSVTEGIDQAPVDDEGKAYDKEQKNVPTQGTFYKFDPTKDGQLEVTVGLEKGKTLIVTEDGEAIIEQKQANDFEGPVSFAVEAMKTYYVFAPETNLKLFGYKFTPADATAGNTAKDIATFKQLPAAEAGKADKLMLNDAVVTYIKGDNVFVEDASGAIDFYQTQIQFYVGQKLNGYIEGCNTTIDNMPVLQRVDGKTKYTTFKVTEKGTPEATAISPADAVEQDNLARFTKMEYVELQNDRQGFRVLADPKTGESVRVEDHFNVFYELGDLMESIEGIVGIDKEGTFIFWPTSKQGVVISDGYKKGTETELDVTNKDVAKTKNNPVEGISVTLDGDCNAGSGSSMAGAMTSKGYKLRTANGSPVKESATFTVNQGKKVYDMTINGIANYAIKDDGDTEAAAIKVTKVEVDGKEVSFEGGEFPAKGASDCGTLTLKDINATKQIVLYFDNSNAKGTQVNIAWSVNYGEKVFTSKELSLLEEAKELAKDRDAIAVGCLDDAIEAAEAGDTEGLAKTVAKFKAANADTEADVTDKVKSNGWKKFDGETADLAPSWAAPAVNTYDGRSTQPAEAYEETTEQGKAVTRTGDILYQEITGLSNGNYKVGFYGTAYFTPERSGMTSDMIDGANDVAYVFANNEKAFITAHIGTSFDKYVLQQFNIKLTDADNGTIKLGLGKDKAGTNWHTIQIYQLTWFTTAREAFDAEKAKLQAAIDEAEGLLNSEQGGNKANLQAAVDAAKETMTSIRKYTEDITEEIAELRAAIELAQSSNIQADYNVAYTEGVEAEAGEEFFLYNIGSGMFLTDGMDWGTHASADHAGRIITLATAGKGFSIYTKPFAANDNDEKAGFMTTNGYVDTANNDAEWEFTPVEIDGYTNAYTISNSSSQYLFYETKSGLYGDKSGAFVNVGNNTNNTKSYWLLIPKSKRDELGDVTYLLRNTDFCHPWELVMWKNTAEWTNYCGGLETNTLAEMYHKSFDVSQEISVEIPNGNYEVSVQGFYNADEGSESGAYLYANSEQVELKKFNANNEGTAANMNGASESFNAGLYVNTVRVIVTDGKLKVGIKTDDVHNWVAFDNFSIKYLDVTPVAIGETVAEPVRFEDGAIYNLRGVKVEGTLKPGLYIKNGKKIVIK